MRGSAKKKKADGERVLKKGGRKEENTSSYTQKAYERRRERKRDRDQEAQMGRERKDSVGLRSALRRW